MVIWRQNPPEEGQKPTLLPVFADYADYTDYASKREAGKMYRLVLTTHIKLHGQDVSSFVDYAYYIPVQDETSR